LIADGYIRAMKTSIITISAAMLVATGAGYYTTALVAFRLDAAAQASRAASCNIKGNISIDTGERIYHMPGQKYYNRTRISPQYGEHWFCSEAEAQAAGWRRAKE
jgi:hypothetical protein